MNLIQHNFPSSQYVNERTTKRQIVLHHTASGPGVDGDINWWMKTPERVATHFIIDWVKNTSLNCISFNHNIFTFKFNSPTFTRNSLNYTMIFKN